MSTHDDQDQNPPLSAPADEAAAEPSAEGSAPEAAEASLPGFPRRALLRAGWAIPAIVMLDAVLPNAAQAVFGNSSSFQNIPPGFVNNFRNSFSNSP